MIENKRKFDMGSGSIYECHKCGFKFDQMNGVGFLFLAIYAKTVQRAKDGELGAQIQKFFEEHPEGAVNVENVTLCCNSCGALTTAEDLTMYIPKKDFPSKVKTMRWTVGIPFVGCEYVMAGELADYYEEYAKYPHKCCKCSAEMHVVKDDEALYCPECKTPLISKGIIRWD